jgi:hypothetical protein
MGLPEVVCYHEAGHAVAYLANGVPIDDVWISDYKGHPGDWGGDVFASPIQESRLRLIAKLAGATAEKRRFGIYSAGTRDDFDGAREIAKESCPPGEVDTFLDEMLIEARRFVDAPDNWAAIERIAGKLKEKVEEAANRDPDIDGLRKACASGDELQEWFKGNG